MLRVARRGVLLIEPHDYVVELQYIKNLGEHAESFVVSGHWFHSARRERADLHHARLSEPCAVQFSFSTPTAMDQLSAVDKSTDSHQMSAGIFEFPDNYEQPYNGNSGKGNYVYRVSVSDFAGCHLKKQLKPASYLSISIHEMHGAVLASICF